MKTTLGWKDVLLVAVTAIFCFAVGEIGVRMFLPAPFKVSTRPASHGRGMPKFSPDPELGWVNTPSDEAYHFQASGRFGSTDAIYHMQHGFRAAAAHPVSGPILLAIGCSFTYGLGVNDDDTWPWQVQERMPAYHVMNAGTSNYGTVQSILLARRLLKQYPGQIKKVVLALADFQIQRDGADQGTLFAGYPYGRPRFSRNGDSIQYQGLVHFWTPGRVLEHSSLLMHVMNLAANAANKTPNHRDTREITMRLIRDFEKECRAQKIAFALVVMPHGADQGPHSKEDRAFYTKHMKAYGIPTLEPVFPRLPDGTLDRRRFLINCDDFHPNREYNVILGSQIADFVKTQAPPTAD